MLRFDSFALEGKLILIETLISSMERYVYLYQDINDIDG